MNDAPEPEFPELIELDAVSDEVTPQQFALLDALRDIALSTDSPCAKAAGDALIRLAYMAFDAPLPEPVQREGGLVGALFGNPVRPERDRPDLRVITIPVFDLVPEADQDTPPGPWPFQPGDYLSADGPHPDIRSALDLEKVLKAAPDGVVVTDKEGDDWTKITGGWMFTPDPTPTDVDVAGSSELSTKWAPLTVVSLPAIAAVASPAEG